MPGSEGTCAPVHRFTDDLDSCIGVNTCNGLGACELKNGGACTADSQCTSQHCVDGVCCDQGCDGTCSSCNQPGSEGSCKPLHGADDLVATLTCTDARTCGLSGEAATLCKLKDGQQCSTSDQCASGWCLTTYRDADGDGYGVSPGVQRCGASALPGYAPNANDCCDSDARANPGVTTYQTFRNACGSFDWNCNGTLEHSVNTPDPIPCGCFPALGSEFCDACK
jgi:hypothetical protein